jgi:hypothetical protein
MILHLSDVRLQCPYHSCTNRRLMLTPARNSDIKSDSKNYIKQYMPSPQTMEQVTGVSLHQNLFQFAWPEALTFATSFCNQFIQRMIKIHEMQLTTRWTLDQGPIHRLRSLATKL